MKKTGIIFIALIMASAISAQSSSDIAQVINTYITNNQSGGAAWSVFKGNYSLNRIDNNLAESKVMAYQLRFASALTLDGKPIFENEIGDAGKWNIILHGARAGAFMLEINTFLIYKDGNDVIDYLKKKLNMITVRIIEKSNNDITAIYKAKGSYFKIIYSMGATGCGGISIYISRNLEDVQRMDY